MKILTLLFILKLFVVLCSANMNPYKVLGIPRNANEKQIRNAYRKLAKDWHPDINKSPEAHEKFMQINQAYEILSDSERRSLYDEYGTTNEPRHASGGGGGYQRETYEHFFRDFDPFESFFGGHGFGFDFNQNRKDNHRKSVEEEINKKIYDETIFPNSHIKPYLIFTYTQFCFSCMDVDNIWQSLKQEIKNIGFGAGHSDASWNRELVKTLGIRTVPSIVGIINGRVHHFRGEYTIKNLREFVRHLIPSRLVSEVNKDNFNNTLHQAISDNKVFALFLSHSNQISLRFQMPCLQMSSFIKCASVKLSKMDENFSTFLKENYRIETPILTSKQEMIVLFKEQMISNSQTEIYNYKPVLFQVTTELPYANILQSFETNKFLNIPRISSSQHFYDICQSWSEFDFETSGKKTPEPLFDLNQKLKLIKKIINDENFFKQNSIRLAYIYSDVQSEFIEKVLKNSKIKFSDNNKSLIDNRIIVLKRIDEKYALFDLLDNSIQMNDLNAYDKLKAELKNYLNNDKKFKFKMTIPSFYEESNQDIISSFIEYMDQLWDYITDKSFWERILNNSSYMMILVCTILFFWLMMMFSSEKSNPNGTSNLNKQNQRSNFSFKEENQRNDETPLNRSKSYQKSEDSSQNTTLNEQDVSFNSSKYENFNINTSNQFQIVEMNPRTYSSLVTDLPKGYRTVLLIVKSENKNQLCELFTKVCIKFSNKSYRLRFAYLNQNTFSGKKWLNEMIYDKYKPVDDENEAKNESDQASTDFSSSETNSNNDLEDYDYEDLKQNCCIDLKADCNVLAISNQQKFYTVFNFISNNTYVNLQRRNSNKSNEEISSSMEQSIGFEESYSAQIENNFMFELNNWLDKFTEGLGLKKTFVKDWPKFK